MNLNDIETRLLQIVYSAECHEHSPDEARVRALRRDVDELLVDVQVTITMNKSSTEHARP